jgi:hypothetical protein
MKPILTILTGSVLATVVFLAQTPPAPEIQVSWDGDRAAIAWKETLADPSAGPDEVPFSILTGPYLGWLTDT